MGTAASQKAADPAVDFIEGALDVLLTAWNAETDRLNGSEPGEILPDGTTAADPPAGITAFYSAFGRILLELTSYDSKIAVERIAVEVHNSQLWGSHRARTGRCVLLCDYTGGGKSHLLFWLILP